MKKIILPILLFLMFIPLYVYADSCDTDKITISSITAESKSDNVEEISKATANGKTINLNLSMLEVGDNIKYLITVKNNSNEDYELNKTSFNLNSDYIDYSISSSDQSNIVKANSNKEVYLKVEYKKEVPDEVFESGIYNDNKTMMVQLSTGDTMNLSDISKNPATGVQTSIFILVIFLIISGTLYVVLKKNKHTKFMILLIGTIIIIPISIYALCKCEIKIISNIELTKNEYYLYSSSNTIIMPNDNVENLKNGTYKINDEIVYDLHSNYSSVLKPRLMFGEDNIYNFFIRYRILNRKVNQIHMGYIINNHDYYLEGLTLNSYQRNSQIMLESFGSDNCTTGEYEDKIKYTTCYIPKDNSHTGLYINTEDTGEIDAFDSVNGNSAWSCMIYNRYTTCTIPD